MRALLVGMALLVATPGLACDANFLTVTKWDVKAKKSGYPIGADVKFSYQIKDGKAYRLIEAAAVFTDALGMDLGRIAIPRTKALAPGETGTQSGVYGEAAMMAIPEMNRDDVKITTCTYGVVYADGTQEEFK